MTKKILALAILVMTLFLMGCNNNDGGTGGEGGNQGAHPSGGGGNVEEKTPDGEFFFNAIVTDAGQKGYLMVEVVDSNVAFGPYHVIVGEQTVYIGADGATITREDIKKGDKIQIIFGGQVMQSYPPKIAATKITVLK